jgi:transposase-like protein
MGARRYSEAFKARMVERMTTPGGFTALQLAREVGVPRGTLTRWRLEAGTVDSVSRKRPPPENPGSSAELPERHARSAREWPPAEKLRILGAAAQLKDEELGELLRREGLHMAQLDEWRAEVLAALGQAPPPRKDPNAQRLRELEHELARKDKALAEVTALLVLRKKLVALFDSSAEEGDSTDEKYGKK